MRITLIDSDEARDVHALAFPEDVWVGDEHTFWVAKTGRAILGFCSAIHRPERNDVFLSRCAVAVKAQGLGVQRRLIRHRVAWAQRQGAAEAVTYTRWNNYPSMRNLLHEGFRFCEIIPPWTNKTVHYYRKELT